MSDAPIVVSGVGAVSAYGTGVDRLWSGLCSARTAIHPLSRFPVAGYATEIGAEVDDSAVELRQDSRADAFGVAAAVEAVRRAGFPGDLAGRRAGVFFGSSTGGMWEAEQWYAARAGRPVRGVSVRPLATHQVSAPGEAVARALRVAGPVETVSSACASATLAIELGLAALREGAVDLAIVGGADSLCRVTYGGFNALQSVDPNPSSPFTTARHGLSLGEGGAALVLERAGDVASRGGVPVVVLAGAGCAADAHHMTAPHPAGRGAALAVRRALLDAETDAGRVDFVNAHGTGTAHNDHAEFAALAEVFGQRLGELPVTCTKASVGHLLGSAGAIEAVVTVIALDRRSIPPTPGDAAIDPETPVRLIRDRPHGDASLQVGISLNLAFGGCNGALVFRRRDSG